MRRWRATGNRPMPPSVGRFLLANAARSRLTAHALQRADSVRRFCRPEPFECAAGGASLKTSCTKYGTVRRMGAGILLAGHEQGPRPAIRQFRPCPRTCRFNGKAGTPCRLYERLRRISSSCFRSSASGRILPSCRAARVLRLRGAFRAAVPSTDWTAAPDAGGQRASAMMVRKRQDGPIAVRKGSGIWQTRRSESARS